MTTATLICTNIFGWPAIHLFWATIANFFPERWFSSSALAARRARWADTELTLYRRWFRIRLWKGWLPDGGAWFGRGFAKGKLLSHDAAYLARYAAETRRGELAHWAMLASTPVFFLWNPKWACYVMAIYGFATNAPCIMAQRYNRAVIETLLQGVRSHGSGDPDRKLMS